MSITIANPSFTTTLICQLKKRYGWFIKRAKDDYGDRSNWLCNPHMDLGQRAQIDTLLFPFPSSFTMKFVSRSIVDQDKELQINDQQTEQGTVKLFGMGYQD